MQSFPAGSASLTWLPKTPVWLQLKKNIIPKPALLSSLIGLLLGPTGMAPFKTGREAQRLIGSLRDDNWIKWSVVSYDNLN